MPVMIEAVHLYNLEHCPSPQIFAVKFAPRVLQSHLGTDKDYVDTREAVMCIARRKFGQPSDHTEDAQRNAQGIIEEIHDALPDTREEFRTVYPPENPN